MNTKFVYGPVPSRRLGQSLGVDPIPLKTCNWNCVYCQLGRTSPLVTERGEYAPADEIVSEIRNAVRRRPAGGIDWITFVGSGEPTLHSKLGWLLREVKSFTQLPLAVITNGSLLHLPAVRRELALADAVMPSLDAGSDALFRTVNRPHASVTFKHHVDGLIQFSREYEGQLWVEVMLISGLNDDEQSLTDLAAVLRRVRPQQVHLNVPVRPPCEPWVRPAEEQRLMRAVAILGEVAHVVQPVRWDIDLGQDDDVVEAILAIISRHPMRETEVMATLARWSPADVSHALERLRDNGQAQVVTRFGQRFWSSAQARYVNHQPKQRRL